jgi:ABC-type polysaccharide/polyol phosphate export permease
MTLLRLVQALYDHAGLVFSMALQQVRRRYIGTVGGTSWSVLQPLLLVATYWFVFSVGFKVQIGDGSVSYIAYFLTGMAAWFLMSESIGASVVSVSGNAHLIKKVVFPVEALPVSPIITSVIVHAGLILIVLGVVLIERRTLPWAVLQLPYYTACAVALCLGLAWLTASLQVFFRDVQKLVEVIIGIWFWLTPIVWSPDMLGRWQWALDFNPAYYVVRGYRDSLIYGVPVWAHPVATAAFWTICLVLLALGAWVFERLKPDFAEVL